MPFFTWLSHRLFYREQGAGPLLLILPGNTASSACHENELGFFASLGYHSVSFDFLGTGQSDRLPGAWPLNWWDQNAQAAVALIDHLAEQQAILVGTSGGAITALLATLRFPERIQSVIADSLIHTWPHGAMAAEADHRAQRLPGQVAFWSFAQGPDWETVVDADSDLLRRLDQANPDGLDLFQGRLREINCPVLFTASLTDSLIPEVQTQAAEMAVQVRGSWLFAVNAGDHPLMWSCSAAFQSAAKRFLTQNG